MFTLTRQDAQASNAVVTGILPIDSQNAHVLFDSGATYFFISTFFATTLGRDPSPLGEFLIVATPMGHSLLANSVYKSCEILLEGKSFMADLIELDMVDFDVILGMDSLAACHATLDCHNKVVKFDISREPTAVFQGDQNWSSCHLISTVKAHRLLRKGCQGYLAMVKDVNVSIAELEQVPVVCEYPDVFPEWYTTK